MSTHVAGVCGSLREHSASRVAVRDALAAAERAGASTDLVDLRDVSLPLFDPDHRDAGDAPALRGRLRDADAIVLATPVYHGSYGSPLKTALDYAGFDEFEGKTVGLLAVAGGSFPVTALDHLRSVMRSLDAWVLPHEVAVPNASDAVADGELVDPDIRERVDTLGRRVVRYANIEPDPATFESEQNEGA